MACYAAQTNAHKHTYRPGIRFFNIHVKRTRLHSLGQIAFRGEHPQVELSFDPGLEGAWDENVTTAFQSRPHEDGAGVLEFRGLHHFGQIQAVHTILTIGLNLIDEKAIAAHGHLHTAEWLRNAQLNQPSKW